MRALFKTFGVLAVLSCGCTPIVLDPLQPEDEIAPPPDLPPVVIDTPNAIALRRWQAGFVDPGFMGEPDPQDLALFFSSRPQVCDQPLFDFELSNDPVECAAEAYWQVVLTVPADLVKPGILDTGDTAIGGYRAVQMAACGGGTAAGMGIVPGTLEIVSVSADSISVKLDVDPMSGWSDPSRDYIASFCP